MQHTPTWSDRLQPSSAGTKHIVYLERQIVLVPLKDCLPTEAAVGQKKIEEMVATVTAEGFFPAPVIASKHPATQQILLLDGNHRRTVGALMGLKYIPVVFIGWDEFEVDVWNRALSIENGDSLDELFSQFDLTESKPALAENNSQQALLHYRGKSYTSSVAESNKIKQHQWVDQLFSALEGCGFNTGNCFITKQATDDHKANPDHLVVELPRFAKEELLEMVQQGEVLPAKAYRTLLPHGPIRLPIKIQYLREFDHLPYDFYDTICSKLTADLRCIPFVQLPNEIDVSDNDQPFHAPLKLAPLLADPNANFVMLDREELSRLSPLFLKNTFSKSITPTSGLLERAQLLAQKLEVSIQVVISKGEPVTLVVEGPVLIDLEQVLELCASVVPLEPKLAKLITDRDRRILQMNTAKQVVFLNKGATQAHNAKYPQQPS